MVRRFNFREDNPMADPVPRAKPAYAEIEAATEAQARLMEDYRTGRATAAQVTAGDMRLAKAHRHAYDVESGRIDDFRN
jgi:hypothetical protein